jgi:anion-transporting  ArsA/GET3 family ATPase
LGTPISIDWALLETGERYEQDQIHQELLYIKNRISTSAAMFTDKAKTAFFFVIIPEAGIINDTQKAPRTFAQFDVPAAGYVVNRVIPHELQEVIRPAGALKGYHRRNGVGPLPLFRCRQVQAIPSSVLSIVTMLSAR